MSKAEATWLAAFALLMTILIIAGCASDPEVSELLMRQRQIVDCYAVGGHVHLGPGNTIICLQ